MSKHRQNFIKSNGYFCSKCQITEWQSQPITLELDHIDGNNRNNSIENLRLLCPNCHSQTSTFRGKNITKSIISDEQFIQALNSTTSIRQALIQLGLTPKGLNYKRAHKLLNIQTIKPLSIKNSQYNTIWIHNNGINKKIKSANLAEYLSLGWTKGRIQCIKPPSQKGKIWVTNGITNHLVIPTEVPEGFFPGRFQ